MNLIIPMAGRGSRLRPHTLTVPKPVVPVAGKAIVHRLAETLGMSIDKAFDEIAFVIGDFGPEIEESLHSIAGELGSRARIYEQEEPRGPAHAIYCALDSLQGPCIVAFADTLFYGDFDLQTEADGMIWVHRVENPSQYGVVITDDEGIITRFEEKPSSFVSDLAIVGIYYFADSERMKNELERVIEQELTEKGEFQITTVLENLTKSGYRFEARTIETWLDCGNKDALLMANRTVLDKEAPAGWSHHADIRNSSIIEPCFIGQGATIRDSVIGPYVSIGDNTVIERSIIENSVIQNASEIIHVNIKNSMIGNHARYTGKSNQINIGDYSELQA